MVVTSFGGAPVEYSGLSVESLSNVNVDGALHGDILRYDAIDEKWIHTSNLTQANAELINNAANLIYTDELFDGVILRDCNGAPRTDTTGSAASIVNRTTGPQLRTNNTFRIMFFNIGTETLTIAAGAGVTIFGNATVLTNTGQEYLAVVQDHSEGAEEVYFFAV